MVAIEIGGGHLRRIRAASRILRNCMQAAVPVACENQELLVVAANGDVGAAVAVEIGSYERLRAKWLGQGNVDGGNRKEQG